MIADKWNPTIKKNPMIYSEEWQIVSVGMSWKWTKSDEMMSETQKTCLSESPKAVSWRRKIKKRTTFLCNFHTVIQKVQCHLI